MSMQLFSFGHPCEYQLKRPCIGGTNCPLTGYPDTWCCSFVKGKINFKRDKPCEGPRCRWGFVHPPQPTFDAVTQVLQEAKAIATKIDSGSAADILTFTIEGQHVADTALCTLHFLRTPQAACARKIGQLFAYTALKARDAKVFTTLLKTMKKPIDNHLLGAYDYLMSVQPPSKAAAGGQSKKTRTKPSDDVYDDLKCDVVEIMNSALSHGGMLVDREDQRLLQTVFCSALRSLPKNKKKFHDMLEAACAKFGAPDLLEVVPSATASTGSPTSPSGAKSGPPQAVGMPPPAQSTQSVIDSKPKVIADAAGEEPHHTPQSPPLDAATASASVTPPSAIASADGAVGLPKVGVIDSKRAQRVAQGISKLAAQAAGAHAADASAYAPLQQGSECPDIAVLGGLFDLRTHSRGGTGSLLGPASVGVIGPQQSRTPQSAASPPAAAAAPPAAASSAYSPFFGPMDVFATSPTRNGGSSSIGKDDLLYEGVLRAWGQQCRCCVEEIIDQKKGEGG